MMASAKLCLIPEVDKENSEHPSPEVLNMASNPSDAPCVSDCYLVLEGKKLKATEYQYNSTIQFSIAKQLIIQHYLVDTPTNLYSEAKIDVSTNENVESVMVFNRLKDSGAKGKNVKLQIIMDRASNTITATGVSINSLKMILSDLEGKNSDSPCDTKSSYCPTCMHYVLDGIECDGCGYWFHPICANLTVSQFEALQTAENSKFICPGCQILDKETPDAIIPNAVLNPEATAQIPVNTNSGVPTLDADIAPSTSSATENSLKERQRLLNLREKKVKHREDELKETIEQLAVAKSFISDLERKVLELEKSNRILSLKLSAQPAQPTSIPVSAGCSTSCPGVDAAAGLRQLQDQLNALAGVVSRHDSILMNPEQTSTANASLADDDKSSNYGKQKPRMKYNKPTFAGSPFTKGWNSKPALVNSSVNDNYSTERRRQPSNTPLSCPESPTDTPPSKNSNVPSLNNPAIPTKTGPPTNNIQAENYINTRDSRNYRTTHATPDHPTLERDCHNTVGEPFLRHSQASRIFWRTDLKKRKQFHPY